MFDDTIEFWKNAHLPRENSHLLQTDPTKAFTGLLNVPQFFMNLPEEYYKALEFYKQNYNP